MIKCANTNLNKSCTPDMDCYINSPQHYNCYCVWQHFNGKKEYSLEEIAQLIGVSHQAISQIIGRVKNRLKNTPREP